MSEPKILVCDDSILARKQLSDVINEYLPEVKIFSASNGEEALNVFKDKKPDLTFIDLVMPKMDGIEAIKKIKEEDEGANIIVVSSIGTKNELKKAIEAGSTDFIQKPFSVEQIRLLLKSYFKEEE